MAANVLSGKAKMDEITEKIDPSKQNYVKLKKLTESINSLGRSICENVASKEQEIETKAKKDTLEATENAIYTMVSDVHKDLMPDGSDMPASRFLDIASFIMPSKKKPSDFYDVFRVDKDNIGIVLEHALRAVLQQLMQLPCAQALLESHLLRTINYQVKPSLI